MSAEQWEELIACAKKEAIDRGQCTRPGGDLCRSCKAIIGLALFARMMAAAMRVNKPCEACMVGPYAADLSIHTCEKASPWTGPTLAGLGRPSPKLLATLRRFHDGSDRGELKELLCEAWPKPISAGERGHLADLRDQMGREAVRAGGVRMSERSAMTAEDWFAIGVARICEMLHMSKTGAGEAITEAHRVSALDYLESRLREWTDPHPTTARYDGAFREVIIATLEEQKNR